MISVYDWSYVIDNRLVRITMNQPMENKIIAVARTFSAQQVKNIKGEDNQLFFALKNPSVANDFINELLCKYPNSFSLANTWDISQSALTTISFSSISDTPAFSRLKEHVDSLFADLGVISGLTNNKISNFNLNIDSSVGYMSFDITFASPAKATTFIQEFNRFKK